MNLCHYCMLCAMVLYAKTYFIVKKRKYIRQSQMKRIKTKNHKANI